MVRRRKFQDAVTVGTKLERRDAEKLRVLAERHGMRVSELVRELILSYIAQQQRGGAPREEEPWEEVVIEPDSEIEELSKEEIEKKAKEFYHFLEEYGF